MNVRIPILLKFVVWTVFNLLLLMGIFFFLLQSQFGTFNNWLLSESAKAKIQAFASSYVYQIRGTPPDDWTALLAKAESEYSMRFGLYDMTGKFVAGEDLGIPESLRKDFFESRRTFPRPASSEGMYPPPPPPPGRDAGPEQGRNGPPPRPFPPDAPGSRGAERGMPPENIVSSSGAAGLSNPLYPMEASVSDAPRAYWIKVFLPQEPAFGPFVQPVLLIGVSDSLGKSPLLFNPYPWLIACGSALFLSLLTWGLMARHLTLPIKEITRASGKIAEGCFDIHLEEKRQDELGHLSHSINRMADRLSGFVKGQKRFLGDVSHELCSPLARMEMALSILEQNVREGSEEYINDVREELTHMRMLVNELLRFSKASLTEKQMSLQDVDVSVVIGEAVDREDNGSCVIEQRLVPGVIVRADPELLRRALANLIRNALRYAGDKGPVTVEVVAGKNATEIRVIDQGPGVPAGDLEKIFDPFYRVDASRTNETGGTGLGLAIVKSCVLACGGKVSATNLHPRGFMITLSLPSG